MTSHEYTAKDPPGLGVPHHMNLWSKADSPLSYPPTHEVDSDDGDKPDAATADEGHGGQEGSRSRSSPSV